MANKKITITIASSKTVKEAEIESVESNAIKIASEGYTNYSELVGVLLIAYQKCANKFLENHECKDCTAFVLHTRIKAAIDEAFINALNS